MQTSRIQASENRSKVACYLVKNVRDSEYLLFIYLLFRTLVIRLGEKVNIFHVISVSFHLFKVFFTVFAFYVHVDVYVIMFS